MRNDFLEKMGLHVPEIMLPAANADYMKWSVVACDQFTAQPAYWDQVEMIVGDAPSTYRITLPEIFLEESDCDARIQKINQKMDQYLAEGVLESKGHGFVLVERKAHGHTRRGLVVALDLEQYDYALGSKSLIRATEGTVIERIPARKKIRKHASIETPHIMVLLDDPKDTVIGKLFETVDDYELLYQTKLMQGGGEIKGWMIFATDTIAHIAQAIGAIPLLDNMLYAVGDGNHSLASAKAHWEDVKKALPDEASLVAHPARFAMVELVNVYDKGLDFEPIHRVVFDCDYIELFYQFEQFVKQHGGLIEIKYFVGENANQKMRDQWNVIDQLKTNQKFSFVTDKVSGIVIMDCTGFTMTVATLQAFLDEYLKENSDARIDYIHGAKIAMEIGSQANNLAFVLPPMSKFDLFPAVVNEGALPRKTFSMGEANEKRYYMECRKIIE
ncbi:MAG: DUF1015 domain-containing protein [Clostridia bacterium]